MRTWTRPCPANLTCYHAFDELRKTPGAEVIFCRELERGDIILGTAEGLGIPMPRLVISIKSTVSIDYEITSTDASGIIKSWINPEHLCAVYRHKG